MFTSKKERKSPLSGERYRLPGQSLDERIQRLRLEFIMEYYATVILVICTGLIWLQQLSYFRVNVLVLSFASIAAISWVVINFFRRRETIQRYTQGRDGEREMAHRLQDFISKGYCILHDIDTGYGNTDHVLIGPSGIYTIETKAWSKPKFGRPEISYNDEIIRLSNGMNDLKSVRQAKAESHWVKDHLNRTCGKEFFVRPLVVFLGWHITEPSNIDSLFVWVLNPGQISYYLNKSKVSLSQEDINTNRLMNRLFRGFPRDEICDS